MPKTISRFQGELARIKYLKIADFANESQNFNLMPFMYISNKLRWFI